MMVNMTTLDMRTVSAKWVEWKNVQNTIGTGTINQGQGTASIQ
jgi:hypothetical protein